MSPTAENELIAERLDGVPPGRLLVASDFDGTLAEIVDDPARARLLAKAEQAIRRLVPAVLRVAVISGRPRSFLEREIPIEGVRLLGDHGQSESGNEEPYRLGRFNRQAESLIRPYPGVWLEAKPASTSIHFRGQPGAGPMLLALMGPVAESLGLAAREGRMVIDVLPSGAGKHRALQRLLAQLRPGAAVFMGDDSGDQPAFELLARRQIPHIALGVSSPETDRQLFAACDLVVDGPAAAAAFLDSLAGWAEGRNPAN